MLSNCRIDKSKGAIDTPSVSPNGDSPGEALSVYVPSARSAACLSLLGGFEIYESYIRLRSIPKISNTKIIIHIHTSLGVSLILL